MSTDSPYVAPSDIVAVMWKRKWVITIAALISGGLFFLASFFITPKYQASVTLLPDHAGDTGDIAGLLSRASSLASIIGVQGGGGSSVEAVEFLKSAVLRRDFILKYELLPVLYQDRLDPRSAAWKDGEDVPSLYEAVDDFGQSVLSVGQDPKTGVVNVSIDWIDPVMAAGWANQYVQLADDSLRQRELTDSRRTLEFLVHERERTNVLSVQQAIASSMEQQVGRMAMAGARSYFAYRIIDPAAEPDENAFYWPRRILIAFAGATVGALFVAILFVIRSGQGPRRSVKMAD